jgi:hypothetical protein
MKQMLASMAGLPRWVQLWLPILFGTNLASLLFLDTEVGRATAIAFAVVCVFNMPMMIVQRGLTRLLAFPHFVWIALGIYLYGQLWGAAPLAAGSARTYAITVFALNTFSLLFDVVDAVKWLRGGREVLGLRMSASR